MSDRDKLPAFDRKVQVLTAAGILPRGPIPEIDPDIVEADARKGPPADNLEANHRYLVMQAEQMIRIVERHLPDRPEEPDLAGS